MRAHHRRVCDPTATPLAHLETQQQKVRTNESLTNAFKWESELEGWTGAGTHAVEAAEAEVEEDRGYEREGGEEEKQAEEAAGRKEAAEAEEGGRWRGPLGGGEKGERRRLPAEPEEPSHAFSRRFAALVLTFS